MYAILFSAFVLHLLLCICLGTSGVPQGTVLGPILFLIFINDLAEYIQHSTLRLFADDSIIYKQIKNKEDAIKLQQDLDAAGVMVLICLSHFKLFWMVMPKYFAESAFSSVCPCNWYVCDIVFRFCVTLTTVQLLKLIFLFTCRRQHHIKTNKKQSKCNKTPTRPRCCR
jgi:hypothetical protein